jgi:Fe-S cluster assembly iron-binding protein IscA
MLTISSQASEAIQGILSSDAVPDGAVVRISQRSQAGPEPEPGLMVSVIDSRPHDDQIVEGGEVEIAVDPAAAEILDDMELDATVVGDQVSFSIGHQPS